MPLRLAGEALHQEIDEGAHLRRKVPRVGIDHVDRHRSGSNSHSTDRKRPARKSSTAAKAGARVMPKPARAAARQASALENRSRPSTRTARRFGPRPNWNTKGSRGLRSMMISRWLNSSGSCGAPARAR